MKSFQMHFYEDRAKNVRVYLTLPNGRRTSSLVLQPMAQKHLDDLVRVLTEFDEYRELEMPVRTPGGR